MKRFIKILSVFCLSFIFSLEAQSAVAADVPLLVWERGRIQQVVVGGGAIENDWQITLEGMGITPLKFERSSESGDGYAIFSIQLPNNLPIGGYTVVSEGNRSPRSVVSGINVIESLAYEITNVPLDLTKVIVIFTFLTGLLAALRARRYSNLSYRSTQIIDIANPQLVKFDLWHRVKYFLYIQRIRSLINIPKSLFRFLLIHEGELLHKVAKPLYAHLPIVGLLAGIVVTLESQKAGGIGAAGLAIFVFVGLIALLDSYSGLFAVIGFWLSQFAYGNINSFRDALIILSVSISWIAPPMFSALVKLALKSDNLRKSPQTKTLIEQIGIVLGAVIATVTFYFGQQLLNSVLGDFSSSRNISTTALGVYISACIVKSVIENFIFSNRFAAERFDSDQVQSISIARVNSPTTAIVVLAATFSYAYLWTESAQKSMISALLFSTPYFLAFIKLGDIKFLHGREITRNLIVEPTLVAVVTFTIYSQISNVALLADQRAELFVVLSALPCFIHGIFCLLVNSIEDRRGVLV